MEEICVIIIFALLKKIPGGPK